jgi:hypothetical protein
MAEVIHDELVLPKKASRIKGLRIQSTERRDESILRPALKLSCRYAETVLRRRGQDGRKALQDKALRAFAHPSPYSFCL